jgi:hypothetical protein
MIFHVSISKVTTTLIKLITGIFLVSEKFNPTTSNVTTRLIVNTMRVATRNPIIMREFYQSIPNESR